jgi:hypothetical protein
MTECCGNCRYFVEVEHGDAGDVEHTSRECRRHAPVLEPRIDANAPDRGWWPQVEPDEWCGEWQESGWVSEREMQAAGRARPETA